MSAVIVIEYQISEVERDEFFTWVNDVQAKNITQQGYLGSKILYSKYDNGITYVLLQFDTQDHAVAWQNSKSCNLLLDKQATKWKENRKEMVTNWGDFWFQPEVPKWKQIIVSFITVFSLSQIVGFFLKYGFAYFNITNETLQAAIIITIVVIMMVTFAMSFMMNLFHNWLYAGTSKNKTNT